MRYLNNKKRGEGMKRYKISVSIEREVTANNEYEAQENFWIELEDDNGKENTTTENRLADSMEIREIKRKNKKG